MKRDNTKIAAYETKIDTFDQVPIFDDFIEIVRFPKEVKSGFDHNFVIWPSNLGATLGQNKFAARSVHPKSGRTLDIYSNQPGIQFYTGKVVNEYCI